MADLSGKSTLTYAEYKLWSLMNNRKPLKRSVVGPFIKIENLNDFLVSESAYFTENDENSFVKMLSVAGEISFEKIREISKVLRFDESLLFPLFENLVSNSITNEEFLDFLKVFQM